MKTVQLVKLRSGQGKQATVTFEIIGDDFLEHILLSASPPGTVFEMSYQIVEAGTQKGNLHGSGNGPNPGQEANLSTSNTVTHTSTSNEKDGHIADRPKGGELAKWAGILCNDKEFQNWVGANCVEEARDYIFTECAITSRVYLDHDKQAGDIFREIMRDFDKFKHGIFDNRFDQEAQNSYKNQIHVDDMPKHSSNIPGKPLTRDDLETIYNMNYPDDMPKYLVWPPKD